MSFIGEAVQGKTYAPGWFLAHAECKRETRQISSSGEDVVTTADGGKYVPMGSIYRDGQGHAVGFVYEDVDVTYGDMPGSVVTRGVVYADRVFGVENEDLETLAASGFSVVQSPTVTRPDFDSDNEAVSPGTGFVVPGGGGSTVQN